MDNAIITSDITHPAVELIEVSCSARGDFDVETFRDKVIPWALKYNLPPIAYNGPGVALKRAMESLASGPERTLKTTGRKGLAVYTLIALDLTRVDREDNDGTNVGQAEVSARVITDSINDTFAVKIDPVDHPAAGVIRHEFAKHAELYSATYDVKTWLTQKVFPAMQAVRSTDVMGKYWFHASPRNREALLSLQQIFSSIKVSTGRVNVYMTGRSGNDSSIVDLLTDAILEEAERVSSTIESLLTSHGDGTKVLGPRGLQTQIAAANALHERLNKLGSSLGLSLDDVNNNIQELQKRMALLMISMDDVKV